MILESLIKDQSRLTIDCCKQTFKKGTVVELADKYFHEKEVQNAIKLGFLRLLGDAPANPLEVAAPAQEAKKKFLCKTKNKIAFECGTVEPGKVIEIPESRVMSREIQNAINAGMIEDLDGEYSASPIHQPVALEEVVITDEPASEPRTRRTLPRPVRSGRPPVTATTNTERITARPLRRAGGDEDEAEIMDGESRLHIPQEDPLPVPPGRNRRAVVTSSNSADIGKALSEITADSKPEESQDKAEEDYDFLNVFKDI